MKPANSLQHAVQDKRLAQDTDRKFKHRPTATQPLVHTPETRSLDITKHRVLQRQSRVQDRELESGLKAYRGYSLDLTATDKTLSLKTDLQDRSSDENKSSPTIVKSDVRAVCKTVLVDPDGNVAEPEIATPRRKLPSTPAAKIKYPGSRIDISPSGREQIDTNEFYKYRSRSLETKVINDFRFDSTEDLASVTVEDKKEVQQKQPEVCKPKSYPLKSGLRNLNTGSVDNPFYGSSITDKGDNSRTSKSSVEEIQLTNFSALNKPTSVCDYRKRFKERIRLKSKSLEKSADSFDGGDSKAFAISHLSLQEPPDVRKTVAFKELPHLANTKLTKCDYIPKQLPREYSVQRVLNLQGDSDLTAHEGTHLSVEPRIPTIVASKSQSRLYNQSSTETSGLGETITSGCSSQESLAGYYGIASVETNLYEDQGIDLGEEDVVNDAKGSHGKEIIDSNNIINDTNEQKESGNLPEIIDDGIGCTAIVHTAYSQSLDDDRARPSFDYSGSEKATGQMKDIQIPTDKFKVTAYKPPPDFIAKDVKKPDSLKVHSVNVGPNFDDLFNQSRTQQQTVGLRLDQINIEWNKQKRGGSIKSRSSQGSFRSRSGSTRRSRRFLGQKESQWMKWGEERRASFRRRMEKLQKPEPEIPRASTPIKKARQEGLVFIHPDLESKYISEDDINYINRHKHERLKTYKLIEKSKVKSHHHVHGINRLTAGELLILSRFWEHSVFTRSRYISILLSLATTVICILSICSTEWVTYPSSAGKTT